MFIMVQNHVPHSSFIWASIDYRSKIIILYLFSSFIAERLHWLPLFVRNKIKFFNLVRKARLGLVWSFFAIAFLVPLFTSFCLLRSAGPLCSQRLNRNLLHAWVLLCGMDFSLQSTPPSCVVAFPHLSLTSNPAFSLAISRTGSVSLRLMLREAFYKWPYTINCLSIGTIYR